MARVEKLNIALTPDMAEMVRDVVDRGEFASASEVIHEALRDWELKREAQQQEVERLRRLWQEGLNSGPGHFEDIEAIRREARRRKSATTPPEP